MVAVWPEVVDVHVAPRLNVDNRFNLEIQRELLAHESEKLYEAVWGQGKKVRIQFRDFKKQ